MSVRVYQLANDLGMDSKDVMVLLRERGLKVTSASSSIPNIYADALVEELAGSYPASMPSKKTGQAGPGKASSIPNRTTISSSSESSFSEESDGGNTNGSSDHNPSVQGNGSFSNAVSVVTNLRREGDHRREMAPEVKVVSENKTISVAEKEREEKGLNIESEISLDVSSPARNPSKGMPSPGGLIKIPLPKAAPRMPVLFVAKDQGHRPGKVAESNVDLSPRESFADKGKFVATKPPEVSAKSQASPDLIGTSNHVQEARRRSPVINFHEKRAAPMVRFQFAPKGQHNDPFNTLKIPSIPVGSSAKNNAEKPKENKAVVCKAPLIVRDFAQKIGLKPFQLISELMRRGIFASMNQQIPDDIALGVAEKYGFKLEVRQKSDGAKQNIPKVKIEVPQELLPRSPVVCVLGHVDHGKTTLLDMIRHANVVAGEAGGITQHVGAYQVEHESKKITFLDTPGHAAFSNMRERGANLTDIAILVVAADDGFMPQTDEALKFAQKAGVPMVVAINKIDVKGANLERVKQQMQQRSIAPEEWGGDTLCVGISALKGMHINELLSAVLLQAEIMELKADYKCPAAGVIIESQMDVGRGTTATVIVKKGTLKMGDAIVCDGEYCRVRSMLNERSEVVAVATPSMSVRVIGWSGVPGAGNVFEVVKDEKTAKKQAEENKNNAKLIAAEPVPRIASVKALFEAMESQKQKVLQIVMKCDTQGTLEALIGCLNGIKSDRVKIEILSSGVGPVSKSDVEFASSSEAIIVGFNVKVDNGVAPLLKNKGVRVILHNIIYELVDRVKDEMAELLDYDYSENHLGTAEIRRVFELARLTIAGCMVIDGQIERDKQARVYRGKKVLFEGKINSLRREKEDHSEVRSGFECGIKIDGFSAFEEGDRIECFEILQRRQIL
ncbi:MAG: translation initiation factor IF-2 [Puniceicoccales bacterium]|jgi:translation initiation factor IF-2|nr:translation initiation factor IF-2 [Puniceicoccales bacterium]